MLRKDIPNTRRSALRPRLRSNLKKYRKLLHVELRRPIFQGKFAVFHIDRDPDLEYSMASFRRDGLCPCLRASHHLVFVMSLGPHGRRQARLLHESEACVLQGMSPDIVPPGLSRAQVFRGCGNAMTVPVVGAVLTGLLRRAREVSASMSAACDGSESSSYGVSRSVSRESRSGSESSSS